MMHSGPRQLTRSALTRGSTVAGVNAKVSGAVAAKLVARVAGGNSRTADQIQIISAFAVPCIKFDPSRRAFYQVTDSRALHGSAQVSTSPCQAINLE